jgi:mannose-6-phosphate isomerase-like protein (cupin superfamily)
MENIYDINKVIAKLETTNNNNGDYFLDFLQTKSINAGVLILKPKQKDTQEPHSLDEIYYIIKGEGRIQIGEKVHPFQGGMCIFVPSNTPHRFFDNNSHLVVLYFFFR